MHPLKFGYNGFFVLPRLRLFPVEARIAHAYGISSIQAPGNFRFSDMAGTFTSLMALSLWLVNKYVGLAL